MAAVFVHKWHGIPTKFREIRGACLKVEFETREQISW
jgi:hypothetical protein